ncbi:MAG: SUMF1/EgtB/PvdO family nonheme iron enzyme [Saprospiraceae bacterium]
MRSFTTTQEWSKPWPPTFNDTLPATLFRKALVNANPVLHGQGETFNGKLISYGLANANLGRFYYNQATSLLNNYLRDSLGQAALADALHRLEQAYISDSVAWDVLHAFGVVHYYAGSPQDTLLYYYDRLAAVGYFDTLSYTPNLSSLLSRERSRVLKAEITTLADRSLEVSVDYYLAAEVNGAAYLSVFTKGQGVQPATVTADAEAGPGNVTLALQPPDNRDGRSESIHVQLIQRTQDKVIDTKIIDFSHEWATKRMPEVTENTPDNATPPNGSTTSLRITGSVLDASSRKPVSRADIFVYQELPGATSRTLLSKSTLDGGGLFGLDLTANGNAASQIIVTVEAEGYAPEEVTLALRTLVSRKEPLEFRLKREVARPLMRRVKGGTFTMGNPRGTYSDDERPTREVTLSNFNMGTYEVTFEEYDIFCEATGRRKPDDQGWGRGKRPVMGVTWFDAIEYCNWLSEQHGLQPVYEIIDNRQQQKKGAESPSVRLPQNIKANGYRLPTEAEWEYAAKGANQQQSSADVYAGSNPKIGINQVAWFDGNSNDQTHPVGQLYPNNAGLYDMSGNVWEWCFDWFGTYPNESDNDPMGPEYGSHRIIRGGAWIQRAEDCRVTVRQFRVPEEKAIYIGFRLVRN